MNPDLPAVLHTRMAGTWDAMHPPETKPAFICEHVAGGADRVLCTQHPAWFTCVACYADHVDRVHPDPARCDVCEVRPATRAVSQTLDDEKLIPPFPARTVDGVGYRVRPPVTAAAAVLLCDAEQCRAEAEQVFDAGPSEAGPDR